ncbi:hypothetical protein SB781_35685, partial [Paraburkholderia sp. SIMBA_061]
VSHQGNEAAVGKVVHDVLADYIQRDTYNISAACNRHGLIDDPTREEIVRLVEYGVKAWGELAKYFSSPKVECHVQSEVLASPCGDIQL